MIGRGAAIASPCINICILDPRSGWCTGCGRTIDEIAAWATASPAAREATLVALPTRLATLRHRSDRPADA